MRELSWHFTRSTRGYYNVILLKLGATRLSAYCEAKELLPEEQSAGSARLVRRRIWCSRFAGNKVGKESARAADPVFHRPRGHTILSIARVFGQVLARFRVPPQILEVIR